MHAATPWQTHPEISSRAKLQRPPSRAVILLLATCSVAVADNGVADQSAGPPVVPEHPAAPHPNGHLGYVDGYLVLHVAGTPEQMGEQHGRLLRSEVRRMINDLIHEGVAAYADRYRELIAGARVMERFLPEEYQRELRALATAADVNYYDLVLAQLFGDVERASYCTSYAVYGPATKTGECIVGRNMDFWDHGVTEYGAVIIHFTPDRGRPFFAITWAGIINGWTLMNADGIVVANNTAYSGRGDSLEGISTCFMLRKVAQYARTVAEGIDIIKATSRAAGTNMIVAGGNSPAAAIVEFDHETVQARWANEGVVLAANEFRKLYRNETDEDEYSYSYSYGFSRYDKLERLIRQHYGRIDRSMNFAAADGVPLRSMNLQCVLLFPRDLSFNVAMGTPPACDSWFRRLRMTDRGIVKAH